MLVTGGLGYIGSHTVKEYLESIEYLNGDVVIVDNLTNSNIKVLDNIRSSLSKKKERLFFYQLDCRDNLDHIFTKHNIQSIIHFAALKSVNDSVKNPLEYYDNNINSLINLLRYCDKYKVNKFIFSSSCSIYGDVSSSNLPVNEDTPIHLNSIKSPYAFTKMICENILKDYVISKGMNVVILRYFNPVGSDEKGLLGDIGISNLLPIVNRAAKDPNYTMKIYGKDYNTRDGTCIRDYIHVTDLALAHLAALKYSNLVVTKEPNERISYFNLGSESGVTVLELINAYEKFNNVKVKYEIEKRREGDIPAIYSDCSKAKKELNWQTTKDIKDIVVSAYKFSFL